MIKSALLILGLSLLLFSCDENAVEPYKPGAIEGYVRLSPDAEAEWDELAGIEVFIRGSNLSGITDSEGYFLILNIPLGLMN